MGLVADPLGSPGPVQADSIAVGSAVGAFTLSDLPSMQHLLSLMIRSISCLQQQSMSFTNLSVAVCLQV